MLLRYFDENIDKETFEWIWMEHTKSTLYTCRFLCWHKVKPMQGMEYTAPFVHLAFARLAERSGQNNKSVREFQKLRADYLMQVKEIWKDYHYGLLSRRLPYTHKKSRNGPDWYYDYEKGRVFRKSVLFFLKYKGVDNAKAFRPAFKSLCNPLLNCDFDAFFDELQAKMRSTRHFHFVDFDFVLKK